MSPLVPIQLGDMEPDPSPENSGDLQLRTRNLRITHLALYNLENGGLRSLLEKSTWSALEIDDIAKLVSEALLWEDPACTPEWVAGYLGLHNIGSVMEKIASAWNITYTGSEAYLPLELKA